VPALANELAGLIGPLHGSISGRAERKTLLRLPRS
jgi:hypothetical protein